MIDIKLIYEEVSLFLSTNLSSKLTYHDVGHTQYVFQKVAVIAEKENISAHELSLLQTAAMFHDIGFVKSHKEHEKKGCKIAETWLVKYGFNDSDRKRIHGMIMATEIPQTPNNLLECIIADADLIYLGTSLYEEESLNLYKELLHFHPNLTIQEWNNIQISFMSSHRYHTKYCKHYYEHRKRKKLQKLIDGVNHSK